MRPRWDIDERGDGIADATRLVPGAGSCWPPAQAAGWKGAKRDRKGARAAVYALIGEVAESASCIRQGRDADAVTYDVATGVLAADSSFAAHGHVLRLRVAGLIG